MKKILTLILFAMMMVGNSFAQSHLVATLDHEGTVSVFTGKDAFINAYEAAADGDVITLSSGAFNSKLTITKAISLYGAGMLPYESASILSDTLSIDIPVNANHDLLIEGMRFGVVYTYGLSKATFLKCLFDRFYHEFNEAYENQNSTDFIHCRFCEALSNSKGLVNLVNCCISCLQNSSDSSVFVCNNCYIWCHSLGHVADVFNSTLTNCILTSDVPISGSNSLFSCLIFYRENLCNDITIEISSLMFHTDFESVFKTWDYYNGPIIRDYETFELTDEAKVKYLGNDGTEVGIYGGAMPYNPTPSVPRIKGFRMDAKPSEGILKADVEVE